MKKNSLKPPKNTSNLTLLLWPLWDCAPPQHGNLLLGRNQFVKDPADVRDFLGIPIIHL